MKNTYVAEFIGTFALIFCGTGAIIVNDFTDGAITHMGIAITFGLIVLAMIYTIGDISGAHINPAVTISFWFAGRFPLKDVAPYIIAQLAGGIFASMMLVLTFPTNEYLGATIPTIPYAQTIMIEIILTFFLMFIVINVSTGAKEKGITAGIAIGSFVALAAIFAGPLTGASMNPARSIAPAVISGNIELLPIYIIAPTIGAMLAILSCKFVKGSESCCNLPNIILFQKDK